VVCDCGLAGNRLRSAQELTPQQAREASLRVRCGHCHEDNDLALKKVPPDLRGLFDRKLLPSGIPRPTRPLPATCSRARMMPVRRALYAGADETRCLRNLHTGLRLGRPEARYTSGLNRLRKRLGRGSSTIGFSGAKARR